MPRGGHPGAVVRVEYGAHQDHEQRRDDENRNRGYE